MNEFISTIEAAKKMGVSRVTVFNMIKDGRIKRAIKVGRNYIIPADFQKDFVDEIAKIILPILKKHHVKRAGIFGSRACGAEHKHSDLDVLVELDKKSDAFCLIHIQRDIENRLGMHADVLTYNSIHHLLRERILRQQSPIL